MINICEQCKLIRYTQRYRDHEITVYDNNNACQQLLKHILTTFLLNLSVTLKVCVTTNA